MANPKDCFRMLIANDTLLNISKTIMDAPEPQNPSSISLTSEAPCYEHSSTNVLIVCGDARESGHAFCFADFLGTCKYLLQNSVRGNFLSCFNLDSYFNRTGYTNVKFGYEEARGNRCVAYYSRFVHNHRQPFFTYVEPINLKAHVEGWMMEKARAAVKGDTVTIIFHCHRSISGALHLGSNQVELEDLRQLVSLFAQNVNVNIVSGSCYSGRILEAIEASNQDNRHVQVSAGPTKFAWALNLSGSQRHRCGQFYQAVMSALAGLKDLEGDLSAEDVLLTDYQKSVTAYQGDPRHGNHSSPQFLSRPPINPATLVNRLLFNIRLGNYTGKAPKTPRQLRCENQTTRTNISLTDDQFEIGKTLYAKFAAEKGDHRPFMLDGGLGCIHHTSSFRNFLPGVVITGFSRLLFQETIWRIFTDLVDEEVLTIDSLAKPIHVLNNLAETEAVRIALGAFELTDAFERMSYQLPVDNFGYTSFPLHWLAIVIIRSGIDEIDRVLPIIKGKNYLGLFNFHKWTKRQEDTSNSLLKERKNLRPTERAAVGTKGVDMWPFAWILPSEIDPDAFDRNVHHPQLFYEEWASLTQGCRAMLGLDVEPNHVV